MVKPIIEGADGVTLTSTGLVAVREHADFVQNALARKASDEERAFRLVMTLNHEGIHFIQCFTAATNDLRLRKFKNSNVVSKVGSPNFDRPIKVSQQSICSRPWP